MFAHLLNAANATSYDRKNITVGLGTPERALLRFELGESAPRGHTTRH
jgi:hypothetical protein